MTTETLAKPARARNRTRPAPTIQPVADAIPVAVVALEVEPAGEASTMTPEAAKAKAIEMATTLLEVQSKANAAMALVRKAQKDFALFGETHNVPAFALSYGGKIYDASKLADKSDEVSVEKLFAEIGPVEALKLVTSTQGKVEEHGGKTLLAKVLHTVTKPEEFKLRKRAKPAA